MSFSSHLNEAMEDPKYWLPAPLPAPPIPVWLSNFIWDQLVPEDQSDDSQDDY